MNTYERHRRFVLRRQRTHLLRRRTLAAAVAAAVFFAAWGFLATMGPDAIAPPAPAELGVRAAKGVAQTAVASINTVHAGLRPAFREEARSAVLRLFDSSRKGEGQEAVSASTSGGTVHTVAMPDASPAGSEPPLATSRTLDILLIGLDSRLGNKRGRADALHLLTVDFDAPQLRITGIPRGTFTELGYPDDASNIIANVHAARGRGELLRRVARMCRRDIVAYYVEVGFSDAYGILELLGYEDPGAELQALRRRSGYQFGDHNRCYNQAVFLRSAVLRMLPLLEGATGEMLLRAGLEFVRTNLSVEQCRGIVYLLNDAGLVATPSLVSVSLRSPFLARIEQAAATVPPTAPGFGEQGRGGTMRRAALRAERRIREALADAERHRVDARRVRSLLWTMFTQHAWLQLDPGPLRRELRDSLAAGLLDSCERLLDDEGSAAIRRTLRADDLLFHRETGWKGSHSKLELPVHPPILFTLY